MEPLLPAVGDEIAAVGNSGTFRGQVTEVRRRCFSNGYGVLILIDGWRFREDPPSKVTLADPDWQAKLGAEREARERQDPARTRIPSAKRWVETLLARDYNPRVHERGLSIKVIANHRTSVTGVKHYSKVIASYYSPSTDEVSYGDLEVDWDSKAIPEDFW